ncbi:ATPase [Caulobacter sp. SLTY]|uniref:SRPBCC family protein n=1 Tax=Caulobacter sp. SLTY TaxID=2683262 RepID=UPI001412DD61|nr:SRPBCC family protein [Caulobacter sp. SLTY]NBB15177.1 ATPase [Caulobacter sp. SLTY]
MSPMHDTLVLERSYPASPARVFAAWADPDARLRWAVPKGEALVFDATDFRVGGRDLSRCGSPGDLRYRIETLYEAIVPGRRLVFSERCSEGETLLSVYLITVEIEPDGAGSKLTLTNQIVALDGGGMIAGSKAGWSAALDNLGEALI